jgi:hypothetical protein
VTIVPGADFLLDQLMHGVAHKYASSAAAACFEASSVIFSSLQFSSRPRSLSYQIHVYFVVSISKILNKETDGSHFFAKCFHLTP